LREDGATVKTDQEGVYRILDANANRATEGLRTVEEFARFMLDDADLLKTAKLLRHDLGTALAKLSRASRMAARDTDSDVGTRATTGTEFKRPEVSEVIVAATERVQQALRSLEEFGKLLDTDFARSIEAIRYRAYTLHRDLELRAFKLSRRRRLKTATLYLLIDCMDDETVFADRIRRLSEAGVDVFQLRDKAADERTLLSRAKLGVTVTKDSGALFIVNDRVDLAVAAGADGVHVGQEEMPVQDARMILGPERLIGVSTHDTNQVHQAISEGADYIGCGPTFPGNTKSFERFPGPAFLDAVHRQTKATPIPAFAIGGIAADNLKQVLQTGFHRIAVTAAINRSADPIAAARNLKRDLQGG
jgi:thiamine-phosphate pyrophosphorylase